MAALQHVVWQTRVATPANARNIAQSLTVRVARSMRRFSRVRAIWLALVLAACGMPPPTREPILPEPDTPPAPTYNSRVVALRTSLGRSAIRLEVRGEVEVLRSSACEESMATRLQTGCARCELAGESEPIDSAVLDALKIAFDRYPAAVLEETHIQNVALCRHLSYEDLDRRAIGTVDLRERRLLISIAPFFHREYDPSGSVTTEDIVHHELFHLFEFERMPDAYVDDPEWRLQNPLGFVYSGDSESASRKPGFINPYAATHEIEDRASIFQYLMARPDELCAIATTDPVVRMKTRLVWSRVGAITGDEFLRERAPCAVEWLDDEEPARAHRLYGGPLRRPAGGGRWLKRPPRPATLQ